jgi:hypothetical protein
MMQALWKGYPSHLSGTPGLEQASEGGNEERAMSKEGLEAHRHPYMKSFFFLVLGMNPGLCTC